MSIGFNMNRILCLSVLSIAARELTDFSKCIITIFPFDYGPEFNLFGLLVEENSFLEVRSATFTVNTAFPVHEAQIPKGMWTNIAQTFCMGTRQPKRVQGVQVHEQSDRRTLTNHQWDYLGFKSWIRLVLPLCQDSNFVFSFEMHFDWKFFNKIIFFFVCGFK